MDVVLTVVVRLKLEHVFLLTDPMEEPDIEEGLIQTTVTNQYDGPYGRLLAFMCGLAVGLFMGSVVILFIGGEFDTNKKIWM